VGCQDDMVHMVKNIHRPRFVMPTLKNQRGGSQFRGDAALLATGQPRAAVHTWTLRGYIRAGEIAALHKYPDKKTPLRWSGGVFASRKLC
jgi:hypothetical protein